MLNSEKNALDYKDHRKHIRYTFQAKCRGAYVKVVDTYIDPCALNRNTLHYTADLKYKYAREKRYIPKYGLSD
jgi:hypothetical protein